MMRQILQSLNDGRTTLAEVPVPAPPRRGVLIRTTRSLISAGTERMLVEFGRAGWLEKARQQPERVRQVMNKMRADGVLATLEAVRSRLDQPLALGYCNAGVVAEVGAETGVFSPGDRVVSNGPHAEWVAVPRNLCAQIPDDVADDEAVFAVVGAIALQGVRLAAPTLGERCAVIGLGLIGLLAVQLLSANGCRVLGIDPDARKRDLARQFGADVVAVERGEEALAVAESFSHGAGIDAVLIAAATDSSEPVTQAARMCRKRGRIVLVGVAGLSLDRSQFYQKELSFQVSCSYGPGRYDPEYEERGNDYPPGFVRWTEQRNFQAVLEMMRSRRLDVRPLISHRFGFDAAPAAYELLTNGAESYVGILLEYPEAASCSAPRDMQTAATPVLGASTTVPGVALVGAGNYAMRVLVPAFIATGARLRGVASSGGLSAAHCARKFGFERATTDAGALIAGSDVDAVVIATRHDSHASLTIRALEAGKHVFVEKPLALTAAEVDAIAHAWEKASTGGRQLLLAVGFNRRFAPHVIRMKALLAGIREPRYFIATVNAGAVPLDHWTRDPRVGGGRIAGEACHFVDLLRFLAGQAIVAASMQSLGGRRESASEDSATIQLRFADGSLGTIHYIASGHRAFPKERIEVFCGGRILQLDNFRRLRGYGWPDFTVARQWRQDKGQRALVKAFVGAIQRGGEAPIPFSEIIEVSRVLVSLSEGGTV